MLLGCIADDFTGASDLANTLAKGGMATVQFVGVPGSDEVPDCDAAVVALKTRSVAVDDAVAQSLAALNWLKAKGCRQILFKYCSTFDSTPEGNIGPVAESLLDSLEAPVAVVCPVFPATGRTLYMGHLFVGDRLLSESGMENHPLNPMTDPDIRRWLRMQTRGEVGLIRHSVVREGAGAIAAALQNEAEAGHRLVVVDAITDADLIEIGAAIANHKLVTGGSGIGLGLPANFRRSGLLSEAQSGFSPTSGRGVALSGSCSRTSVAQVETYLRDHPGLKVEPQRVMDGAQSAAEAAVFVEAHWPEAPIIYSTAEPGAVGIAQSRYGREPVAAALESFFGDLARRLVDKGATRLVVGGGETSGAVVTALDLDYFHVGPEIDPGVPALSTGGRHSIRLALKSGNFGGPDFYSKALAALGTP